MDDSRLFVATDESAVQDLKRSSRTATVLALVELAAAGGYAATNNGAGAAGALASDAIALALGLAIVQLKVLIH